jgi:leucyl/phenylalanyl-tRNA--protein transferase
MAPRARPLITTAHVRAAYAAGLFPMADAADSAVLRWIEPRARGILPLDAFHVPRSLRKTLRRQIFEVTADRDFAAVMRACAAPAPGREQTWINAEILALYTALHDEGDAHSIECRLDGELVGGLYGVSLGAAFFGESMFSLVTDASKVALAHLVAHLRRGGYRLLDTQFLTAHLARFGAIEIPQRRYLGMLADALAHQATFYRAVDTGAVLQESSQTS